MKERESDMATLVVKHICRSVGRMLDDLWVNYGGFLMPATRECLRDIVYRLTVRMPEHLEKTTVEKANKEKGSYPFRCRWCPGDPPGEETGQWQIVRHGDVVVTWTCGVHLLKELRRLEETRPDLNEYTVTRLLDMVEVDDGR